MPLDPSSVRIVVHGSFRKHFDEIVTAIDAFETAGFTVLAPESHEIVGMTDGFAVLSGEEDLDPRYIEARYLHNLKRLGENGFSYFVNPRGYLGRSTSFEWGVAQAMNVRSFFSHVPIDHSGYAGARTIWSPQDLIDYIGEHGGVPKPEIVMNEYKIAQLWNRLVTPSSIVAVGAILEYESKYREKELLFVKTHKWGGRYSMIGEKVGRGERMAEALVRGVEEETGLRARVKHHLVTFDQFRGSGYYRDYINYIFSDYVATTSSKRVVLDDEAEDYVWATAADAWNGLDIEPNAKHTLAIYMRNAPSNPC